jgi:hypothetical protein
MAEEKQRIAILLRGPQCVGKTTTGRLLFGGEDPVSLDNGPPFAGLRSGETVLVLELGRGEDYPIRPNSRPGRTRNPGEWLTVLAEEKRPLWAFFLTADWPAVEVRARSEGGRRVTRESARLSYDLHESHEEGTTLPATAGIRERTIDTTRMTADEVAAEILRAVRDEPPSWRPS